MKKMRLKTVSYEETLKKYVEWLELYNYADQTIRSFPVHVREFMYWLEQQSCLSIKLLKPCYEQEYQEYLNRRTNERGGLLSDYAIHKQLTAVNNFMKYVKLHDESLETVYFKAAQGNSKREIFTPKEVEEMYETSGEQGREGHYYRSQRDRAVLGIYYGCGLRLSEGMFLDVEDVDEKRHLLRVRKGKGGKSREVPIGYQFLEDLQEWIYEGRDWYLKGSRTKALLVSGYGLRLSSCSIYRIMNRLKESSMISKETSVHGLRHSVATHLLRAGMEIEKIREFLGHSSLESTQIYLHMAYEK